MQQVQAMRLLAVVCRLKLRSSARRYLRAIKSHHRDMKDKQELKQYGFFATLDGLKKTCGCNKAGIRRREENEKFVHKACLRAVSADP